MMQKRTVLRLRDAKTQGLTSATKNPQDGAMPKLHAPLAAGFRLPFRTCVRLRGSL
jgi:hypothetical protein